MAGRRTTVRRAAQRHVLCWGLPAVLLFGTCRGLLAGEEEGGWTNRAGHVLKGTPQSIQGQKVRFLQGGADRAVTVPLSVFLPEEQERLRGRLKDTALPEGLKAAYDFSGRVIKRSCLLRENGGMSEAECQKSVNAAAAAFRKQAAAFVAQNQLSQERLELIVSELTASRK